MEASIGLLTLAILAVGVAEYGSLYSTSISLSHAVRAGVAAGSEAGAEPNADVRIITSLINSRGTSTGRDIEKVVIFRANSSTSSAPPTECTASSTTPCNSYSFGPSVLNGVPEANLPQVINANRTSEQWPVDSRVPGVDLIGVQVTIRRTAVQTLVWSPRSLSDHHVGLLTPPPQAPSSAPNTDGFIASPFMANPNPDNTALYYGPRDTSAGGGNPGDGSGFGA